MTLQFCSDKYPRRLEQSVCTWRDTGKLYFDVYTKTLLVCFSGVWQTVVLPPGWKKNFRIWIYTFGSPILNMATLTLKCCETIESFANYKKLTILYNIDILSRN